jgi:hypothetical protein
MEGQFSAWRRGVDVFRKRAKFHTTLVKQNRRVDELPQRARQAVQLPDDHHVALTGVVEKLHQLGPFGFGPGSLFLIDAGALWLT